MTIKFKNKSKRVSSLRRLHSASMNKIDIEDPYWIGNKKSWSWWCPVCEKKGLRRKLIPYKQDKYGNIVVACENPNCIKSGNFDNSISSELARLLKQMQSNSRKFYITYGGGYY